MQRRDFLTAAVMAAVLFPTSAQGLFSSGLYAQVSTEVDLASSPSTRLIPNLPADAKVVFVGNSIVAVTMGLRKQGGIVSRLDLSSGGTFVQELALPDMVKCFSVSFDESSGRLAIATWEKRSKGAAQVWDTCLYVVDANARLKIESRTLLWSDRFPADKSGRWVGIGWVSGDTLLARIEGDRNFFQITLKDGALKKLPIASDPGENIRAVFSPVINPLVGGGATIVRVDEGPVDKILLREQLNAAAKSGDLFDVRKRPRDRSFVRMHFDRSCRLVSSTVIKHPVLEDLTVQGPGVATLGRVFVAIRPSVLIRGASPRSGVIIDMSGSSASLVCNLPGSEEQVGDNGAHCVKRVLGVSNDLSKFVLVESCYELVSRDSLHPKRQLVRVGENTSWLVDLSHMD